MAKRKPGQESYEKQLEKSLQQGTRFAICQMIAAILKHDAQKDDASNNDSTHIMEFWNWYDNLDDPPIKGVCYAAGMWIRMKLKEKDQ